MGSRVYKTSTVSWCFLLRCDILQRLQGCWDAAIKITYVSLISCSEPGEISLVAAWARDAVQYYTRKSLHLVALSGKPNEDGVHAFKVVFEGAFRIALDSDHVLFPCESG